MAVSIVNANADSYDSRLHITLDENDGLYWSLRPFLGEIWDTTGAPGLDLSFV